MIITEDHIVEEAEQVKKAQQDRKAFAPLYEKYYTEIFTYIYRRVNDDVAAGDITSQVFLKALLHLYKWKYEGLPFSSWLYRIALNECRTYFRSSNKVEYVTLDISSRIMLSNDVIENETAEHNIVITEYLLNSLSEDDVQLVQLRYYENLSFKEIGYRLDITENNSKVKLYRILKKLKKLMENGAKV